MEKIFVDTAAWLALLNPRDNLHQDAQRIFNQLLQQNVYLITSEFVLLEVADALSQPNTRSNTIHFINQLRTLKNIWIEVISPELYQLAWQLYSQRLDKGWGLTDCTSFVIMHKHRIDSAFTSDQHFSQAGFIKLL